MPQPIGRYPSGLLGLLNSKSRGQTPAQAEEFVRLTSDISRFYLENVRQQLVGSTSTINLGGSWGASGVGPGRNQIAYVYDATAIRLSALAAGTTYRLSMQYNVIDLALQFTLGEPVTFTAGEFVSVNVRDLWLPPNSQLGVFVYSITLGTAISLPIRADIALVDL